MIGQLANEVRTMIEDEITKRAAELKEAILQERLKNEALDVTLPGRQRPLGASHPLSIVLDEIKEIFVGMGFDIVDGPRGGNGLLQLRGSEHSEETIPARDTQDTFYINENILLRTQTSPVQVRVMEKQKPPIRIISPGRVYRSDAVDATHSPLFHQIEGLVVAEGITFADLKGTLETFVKRLYGEDSVVRVPSPSFPLHGAQRRGRCTVLQLSWRGLPSLQGRRAGSKSLAAAWFTRRYCKTAALIRKSTADSLSAWDLSAW